MIVKGPGQGSNQAVLKYKSTVITAMPTCMVFEQFNSNLMLERSLATLDYQMQRINRVLLHNGVGEGFYKIIN
jgi:hypothetical protein